jgi:hypothetical protein
MQSQWEWSAESGIVGEIGEHTFIKGSCGKKVFFMNSFMNFDKLFQTHRMSFYELITKLRVQFDFEKNSYKLALDGSLQAACVQFPHVTKEEDLKVAKVLFSRLPEQPVS